MCLPYILAWAVKLGLMFTLLPVISPMQRQNSVCLCACVHKREYDKGEERLGLMLQQVLMKGKNNLV